MFLEVIVWNQSLFLKFTKKIFLCDRPLDSESESSYSEGLTTDIFVSCMNLWADAMDELLSLNEPVNRSVPLEVTFTGEFPLDFGGPRREFLSSMLRLIKEKLCIEQKMMKAHTFLKKT